MVHGDPHDFSAYGALLPQHLEVAAKAPSHGGYIVKPPFVPRQRMKMNIVAIFVSLFVPWILFSLLYADTSFRWHYKLPRLCWALVAISAAAVLYFGAMAGLNVMELVKNSPRYQPTWLIFVFLTSLIAVVLGPVMGNTNYWQNMQPYYDLKNLNDYKSVDPSRMRGQQMMDAGRVQFAKGATVDISKAYAFQNLDTYCVAPITMYNPAMGADTPLTTYDFWAVGLNCCGGNSTHSVKFECGAYKSNTATEGLRLMEDQQRAYFRLAVQQAESAHMIKAVHPLFFHWTQDASSMMDTYLENAFRNFAVAMIIFFLVQLCLVFALSYVLSKMGYEGLR